MTGDRKEEEVRTDAKREDEEGTTHNDRWLLDLDGLESEVDRDGQLVELVSKKVERRLRTS